MSTMKLPKRVLEELKKHGSRGGKLGGEIVVKKLTAKQRSARAKKAARARWRKAKEQSGEPMAKKAAARKRKAKKKDGR